MVFDRNAVNVGRTILDFGLGDLKGTYQNTARLRSKGWLVALFFEVGDHGSIQAIDILQSWIAELPTDKVSIIGIAGGEREDLEKFVAARNIAFPVMWDYNDYVATIWSIADIPTLFVTDAQGKVLVRTAGADASKYADVKALLQNEIEKAEQAAKAAAEAKAAADAQKAAEAAKDEKQPAAAAKK